MGDFITPRECEAKFGILRQELATIKETLGKTNDILLSMQKCFQENHHRVGQNVKWIASAERWKWKLIGIIIVSATGGASIETIIKRIAGLMK